MTVTAAMAHDIPIKKMFVRQKLDLLVGQAWLTGSHGTKGAAIAYSVQESVPCPYTRIVAYETTQEKKKKEEEMGGGGRMGIGKTAGLAALAVGGVVLIGFAAMNFGDVAATLANAGTAVVAVGNVVANVAGTDITYCCHLCSADCLHPLLSCCSHDVVAPCLHCISVCSPQHCLGFCNADCIHPLIQCCGSGEALRLCFHTVGCLFQCVCGLLGSLS